MTAVAAAATAAVPDAAAEHDVEDKKYDNEKEDDVSWLVLAAAAPDERALALQTRTAAQDAADSVIGRCATIIKDVDAHVYRRGLAVLALGRTLRRELCCRNPAASSATTHKFRQECTGAGGVLDSVLDIVGQCTAPPAFRAPGGGIGGGKAPALSAGCGLADALAIRTNCCALISLLASAVLAPGTTTMANDGGATPENIDEDSYYPLRGVAPTPEQNGSANGDGWRRKIDLPLAPVASKKGGGGGGGGGGDDWGGFVPMSAEPNPDVVSVVRKKGWAARQQQQLPLEQSPAADAVAVKKNSKRLRVSGAGGRVKMPLRWSSRSAGKECHDDSRSLSRRASHRAAGPSPSDGNQVKRRQLSVAGPAMSPGKTPKGQRQDRTALRMLFSKRASREQQEGRGSGGGPIDGNGRSGAAVETGSPPLGVRKSHHRHLDRHRGPVPYGFASPPRLSRIKGREIPGLGPSSSDWSFPSTGRHGANDKNGIGPLGLSDSRNANGRITAKVWHTVSVSRRKNRREKSAGEQSPPAITLVTGETSERFKTQPPVRQAVIFGSDLVREVEFNTFWGNDNDGIAADAKLGYQVPRLWFPHAKPGQAGVHTEERAPASAGVSMPEPRSRASGGADLPIGTDAVVQEYQQMQAFRAYSALAHARPSPADAIHGADANTALVSALGRHPEEDDVAIAQEWSPRRGRRPAPSRAAAPTADGKREQERCRRRADGSGQPKSPPDGVKLRATGGSGRHPLRGSDWSRSPELGVRGRTSSADESLPASPSLRRKASMSCSPSKRGKGKKRRRRLQRGGEGGGEATNFSSPDYDRDSELRPLRASSNDGSSEESYAGQFDACSRWRGTLSPGSPGSYRAAAATTKSSGNLGRRFTRPESSYRTYRAKHSRLLRARSSERAAARTRRARLRESLDWLPRSRSADGGGGGTGYRRGFSGMTSPLLRGEAFGLLQSSATGKVALGFQLPRDLSSVSGRERTAATITENALRSAYNKSLPETSPLESAGRRRQNAANRHRGWLDVHHNGSLTDGEGTDREDRAYSRRLSRQATGRGGSPDGDSCSNDGAVLQHIGSASAADRGQAREAFSVSRHFLRVGRRWPSPPRRGAGRAWLDHQRRCSASLGRSRGDNRRHRRGRQRSRREKIRGGDGGGCSWSPPRTTTGEESCDTVSDASTAGRNAIATPFDGSGIGGDEYTGDRYDDVEEGLAWSRDGRSQHHGLHRSPSPLLLPLDPYRDSRAVILAGTLVSLRDAATAERASRRAAHCIRRASEERVAAERCAIQEKELLSSASNRYRGRQRRQRRGADGASLGGGWDSGLTASGLLLDVGEGQEEEQWRVRARSLLPSVEGMGRELQAIRRADAAMREEQLAQVQLNTNALPLSLLLVHPGGAARARGFVARALELWQRERARARMTQALARWKIECETQRFRERGLGYRARFGALKIKQLVKKRRPVVLRARLATWRAFCRMEIYTTRAKSVLQIQTQYRRWKAFRLFLSMHYSKPLGGALSDIYLEGEREGLTFKIDSSVRKDRRCFWKASIAIQTRWRMLPKRAFFRLLKKEVKRVQTHFRMWSDRRVYVFFKRQTIKAQSFARLAIWRPKWCRFRVIPPVIQRFVRGHLARQRVRRMRVAHYRALEVKMEKAVPFQTAWRGFAARRALLMLQQEKDREWHAAVLLQRAWYRRMDQFPAFVLVSCLRIMDKNDEDQARASQLFDLRFRAGLLQRMYRRRDRLRKRRAAVLIQSWWRIRTGTDFVARLRAEKWASRKLRCWLTACMKRKHHASWLIALCWLTSRPGRLLKHLQDYRQREEDEWWKAWREGRGLAAAKLQAAVRGQRVRRELWAERAAIVVQRIARGYIHRGYARERLAERRREQAGGYVAWLLEEGMYREVSRQAWIRASAGDKLRAFGRGIATRMILKRAAERVRVEILMAIRMQRSWRNRRNMLAAMRQALKEHRRMRSPFLESVDPRVESVSAASIAAASTHLNPRNGPAGCGLWRLCRRLGCDSDVFPLLRSAGISGAEALRGLSDGDLRKLGISDEAKTRQGGDKGGGGGRGDGIFDAENLRSLLLGLVCTAHPGRPAPKEGAERTIFEDFEYIEGVPHRRSKIRKVFMECFGAALNQRADNFSAALSEGGVGERAEITVHQLRRYFGLCGTPSTAKARLPSLINPPPEEHRRATADDRRRLKASLSILSAGADRVCCLYRVPPTEIRARGGPATELLEALRHLPGLADKEEQRQRARLAARGEIFEIMDEHRRAMLAIATSLYDLLQHLTDLGPAARIVQRAYRSHTGRSLLALSRHKLALKKHYDRYMWERGTNHVRTEWEEARKVEAEEKQRQYEEWLRQEEKRQVEEELYRWGVLRYGWREEDLEGVPGVKVYRFYKRVRAKRDAAEVGPKGPDMVDELREESEAYPLYRYEDEMAARKLVRAGRAYIARKVVYILRRDKLRSEKERLERLEWERTERIADQHLTVRLPLVTVSGKRYFHAVADGLNDDPFIEGEFEPPLDDHLDLWVGFLLDARTPARATTTNSVGSKGRKGNTSSPSATANTASGGGSHSKASRASSATRRGGGSAGEWRGPGEGWMRGEVFLVNPSEVVSAEGVKRYPKGTFGVRYLDTGEEIPDVPRDCIRVLTLTPGMKVEARYGGGLDFYPGIIDGVNTRNGYALSYSVKYEDGDVERVVKRGHIAPFPEEVAVLDAVTAEATRKAAIRRGRAKFLQGRRAVGASAWRERVQKAEDDYLAAAAGITTDTESPQQQKKAAAGGKRRDHRVSSVPQSTGAARRRNVALGKRGSAGGTGGGRGGVLRGSGGGGGGDADVLACLGMIEAATRLREELRPRVAVSLKIEYTRQVTRFGCKQVQTSSGLLWKSEVTKAHTRGRPRYTFEEVAAARKVQAAWAGLQGRRAFRAQLAKQSIRGLGIACINEASSHAWIGHEEEGLTIEMWLLRLGVPPPDARRVAAAATKTMSQLAASRGGGGAGGSKAGGGSGKAGGNRRTQLSSISCASLRNWLGGGSKSTASAAAAAAAGGGRAGGSGAPGAAGDAKLLKLGLESTVDRRRIMAVVMKEEPNPWFINWFEGPADHRTVTSAVASGEEQAFKLVWKAFPGNQSRAESMAKRVANSKFPVTRMQITAWLKRHDGRPGVAQSSMSEQLVDVEVTSSREAEAAAYEVYRLFCQRLSVLASNMRLKGLWTAIAKASAKADGILATHAAAAATASLETSTGEGRAVELAAGVPRKLNQSSSSLSKTTPKQAGERATKKVVGGAAATAASAAGKKNNAMDVVRCKMSGGGSDDDAVLSTWAHARAALVLRTEGVAVALRWVSGSKIIQVAFRGFRCRRSYRALLARRKRAATMLQSAERRKRAFVTAAGLVEQRASPWEQLLDDETGVLYFFCKDTGESTWQPPDVPFRPMIRDRLSGALIQAWPQLERELQEAIGAAPGFCMQCKVERATRICDQCTFGRRQKAAWGGGKYHLCFVCFAERHVDTPELTSHTFTAISAPGSGELLCSLCDRPASRRCRGLELPERALMVTARMLQNARLSAALQGAAVRGQHTTLPSPDTTKSSAKGAARPTLLGSSTTAMASSFESTRLGGGSSGGSTATTPSSTKKQKARPGKPPVSREGFERILAVCQLPYSRTWADAAYELCLGEVAVKGESGAAATDIVAIVAASAIGVSGRGKGDGKKGKVIRTREQFWAAFGSALVGASEDCDDLLCGECWESVHKRGIRAGHRWEGFRPGSEGCVACFRSPAERKCNACNDLLCSNCFTESHARGKKKRHSWQPCLEKPLELPRCRECRRRVGDKRCADCGADLCDSCQIFTHPTTCDGGEEGPQEISTDLGGKSGKSAKHGRKRAPSSGAVGCGGHFSSVTKRQQKEADEVFAALTLEGTELSGDPRTLHNLDRMLGIEDVFSQDASTEKKGGGKRLDEADTQEAEQREKAEKQEDEEEELPLACDVCGKTPDVECEQCGTVYCSNTWVGNPGCFIRDHERGNRRTHTKRGYMHAKDVLERAKRLEKEEKERRERESRENGDARGKEKADKRRRMKRAHEREMARELRLQKEASKELKRRIRHRRARAAGINPSLLPKLRLTATEFAKKRGFFLSQHPSLHFLRIPPGLAMTTRRLVGALRGGGRLNCRREAGANGGGGGGSDGGGGGSKAAAETRSRSRSGSPARRKARKRQKKPQKPLS